MVINPYFEEEILTLHAEFGDLTVNQSQYGFPAPTLTGSISYDTSTPGESFGVFDTTQTLDWAGGVALGTGDGSFEIKFAFTDLTGTQVLFTTAIGGGSDEIKGYLSGGTFRLAFNGTDRYSFTPVVNTAYEVALCRESGTMRFFKDGTHIGASDVADTNDYEENSIRFGAASGGGSGFKGHLYAFRSTLGSARYTANYTVPTKPYPFGAAQISGTVLDETGSPAVGFIVQFIGRDPNTNLGTPYGSAATDSSGDWTQVLNTIHEVNVIICHSSAPPDPLINDIVLRVDPTT